MMKFGVREERRIKLGESHTTYPKNMEEVSSVKGKPMRRSSSGGQKRPVTDSCIYYIENSLLL